VAPRHDRLRPGPVALRAPGARAVGTGDADTSYWYVPRVEIMIGIAALLVGAGIAWVCFALGVYFFTRTGREGIRIARMEEERRQHRPPDA
jgi:hypothetical protein